MANKKNKVDKASLPLVNFENKYIVRYRIVEDKIKSSDWSHFYAIPAKPVVEVNGIIRYTAAGSGVVDVTWLNTNELPLYDIFIRYSESDPYVYHGQSASTNYSIILSPGHNLINVLVQAASVQKRVSSPNLLKVFEGSQSW